MPGDWLSDIHHNRSTTPSAGQLHFRVGMLEVNDLFLVRQYSKVIGSVFECFAAAAALVLLGVNFHVCFLHRTCFAALAIFASAAVATIKVLVHPE